MKKFKALMIAFALVVSVFCFTACKDHNQKTNDNRIISEVLSDSMYPALSSGDKIVIEPQATYNKGDIVVYVLNENMTIAHRIIGIFEEEGVAYYICHGDNVQNIDGTTSNADWIDDAEYVQELINNNETKAEMEERFGYIAHIITFDQIKGAVVDIIRK